MNTEKNIIYKNLSICVSYSNLETIGLEVLLILLNLWTVKLNQAGMVHSVSG